VRDGTAAAARRTPETPDLPGPFWTTFR
jgi:hypothetical protein